MCIRDRAHPEGSSTSNDLMGEAVAVSSSGNTVAAFGRGRYGALSYDGYVRVYHLEGAVWTQKGSTLRGTSAQAWFGQCIALSKYGDVLIARNGASEQDVLTYRYTTSSGWTKVGNTISGSGEANTNFAISADDTPMVLAVAQHGHNTNTGRVQVYEWTDTVSEWHRRGSDILGEEGGDLFGCSLSISADGTVLVVGAKGNVERSRHWGLGEPHGKARVYGWDGTAWNKLARDVMGEAADDDFGDSVSVSANGMRFAVGAQYNDGGGTDVGHTRVYEIVDLPPNTRQWTAPGTYHMRYKATAGGGAETPDDEAHYLTVEVSL